MQNDLMSCERNDRVVEQIDGAGRWKLGSVIAVGFRSSRGGHVAKHFVQGHDAIRIAAMRWLVGFSGYLLYVVRFYSKVAPFIVEARAEWEREPAKAGGSESRG